MPEPDAYFANLARGAQLAAMDRPREAIPFLEAAIAANPDHPQAYADLARAWNAIPAQRAKALRAIDRAISLAPDASAYQGLKSWFLICLLRHRAALATAQKGLAINPLCYQSLNSLANAYTKLARWKQAEAACLRILALNPHDAPALNLLAQALRHQGRWKESRETVARLLANLPNNAFGHANAGFAALAAGDHLRANEHFRESLRLNPHFDLARRGLIASLRARNWIIRFNSRMLGWTRQPLTPLSGTVAAAFIIFFISLFLVCSALKNVPWGHFLGRVLADVFVFTLFYLYLSAIVGLVGNFLLMFDPLGRHALTRQEKMKASLPAVICLLVLVIMVANYERISALEFIGFFVVLAISFQYPLLLDRWHRWRAREADRS